MFYLQYVSLFLGLIILPLSLIIGYTVKNPFGLFSPNKYIMIDENGKEYICHS